VVFLKNDMRYLAMVLYAAMAWLLDWGCLEVVFRRANPIWWRIPS